MYSVDYSKVIEANLPPDKRSETIVAFNVGLVGEISNDSDLTIGTYKEYQILPLWVSGTYARRVKVRYGKSIFQSNEDNNTEEPTHGTKWRLVSSNFLGSDFQLAIRGEKLILEYATNIWFDAIFRQPPEVSDIFFTTNIPSLPVFRCGLTEEDSSKSATNSSTEFVINNYSFVGFNNFTLNIPLSLYNSLASDNNTRDSVIRNFVDKYTPIGINYNIITY